MYNTIEVMFLDIKSAEIKFFKKDGLGSTTNEGLKHIKVLPYLSIVQSIEGSYDISLGDGDVTQTGDGGFFIAPARVRQTIVHHINKKSGRMVCRWLFIDVRINNAYTPEELYCFPIVLDSENKDKMNQLFDELFSTDDFWENQAVCHKILGQLFKCSMQTDSRLEGPVQDALDYITNNYRSPITVADLSRISNMSESNFYSVFRRRMGCSPIAYLNYYRLSLAADLLIETDTPIGKIGYSVGIGDPLYFSKLFKRIYKSSPKEYRTLHMNK
jgi:AraC-like DNA-binding protein